MNSYRTVLHLWQRNKTTNSTKVFHRLSQTLFPTTTMVPSPCAPLLTTSTSKLLLYKLCRLCINGLTVRLKPLHTSTNSHSGADQTEAEGSDSGSFLETVDSPRRPMLALPAPPACSRQTHQEQAAQTLPVSLTSLSPEASLSQVGDHCAH